MEMDRLLDLNVLLSYKDASGETPGCMTWKCFPKQL